MYPYILCYCGRCLSDIYDLFIAMKLDKYEAAYEKLGENIDPVIIATSEAIQIDISDIFEALHLDLDCCRGRMQTQVMFSTYY